MRTLTAPLLIAVIGAPSASAKLNLEPVFGNPGDAIVAQAGPHAHAQPSSGQFDWTDAGIGAAGTVVLLGVGAGGTAALRRRVSSKVPARSSA